MEIVQIASELAPVAKVGGLGDVLHGLSRALLEEGHTVEIFLPKYDTLDLNRVSRLEVSLSKGGYTAWRGKVDGIPVTLIESHAPTKPFERGQVYGCKDDIFRFTLFCQNVLDLLLARGQEPDVIHIHDWHTAVIAPLLKERYQKITAPVLFTIHNLAYQGVCTAKEIAHLGWKNDSLKKGRKYNLMKGGVRYADHVTTVSPTYAQEILTKAMGEGLEATLRTYEEKLAGILNGIDTTHWNPAKDPFLPFHYTPERPEKKVRVKSHLRQRLGLAEEKSPIVASVTRLVPQKNPELIKVALLRTLERGGQFVLLGSADDEKTHTEFYNLKRKLANSHHVHLELTFNEELSHLVFGGADLFLVPSMFEPCGLTQQIAMRYGTVPLVRKTGGLADTVFEGKNGFLFKEPTAKAIQEALDRALDLWQTDPSGWEKLQTGGMQQDWSWKRPAAAYVELYRQIRDSSAISKRR